MDWSCMKLVDPGDISALWSRSFLLHSDWATGIPEYNALSRDDQVSIFGKRSQCAIFRQFFSSKTTQPFPGWPMLTSATTMVKPESDCPSATAHTSLTVLTSTRICIQRNRLHFMCLLYMDYRLERVYGVVARRIIDQVVIPMFEMHISFEEYCILKALALFQLGMALYSILSCYTDFSLSSHATSVCLRVQKKLRDSLSFLVNNMLPDERCRRLDKMESLVSTLMVPFVID